VKSKIKLKPSVVVYACGRLREEDLKFEVSLGYMVENLSEQTNE
jgi:hypothetical protein